MADKMKAGTPMTTRQKVTIVLTLIVVIILGWQVLGMFGGGSAPQPAPGNKANKAAQAALQSTPTTVANLPAKPVTEREAGLIQMQQETQAKYIEALNQLQLLKVARDIAVTNKDISTARLSSVVSDKKAMDLLSPPAPPQAPAQLLNSNVVNQANSAAVLNGDAKYSVLSVSLIQGRWGAILSAKGSLYNVHTGDVIGPDGAKVISISKDGVTIQQDGVSKRLPFVATI